MTSYCAPCIADLALVREAVTSVAGTASCLAHAVLLTHHTDDPARRRQRLDALRDLASGKAETADQAEQVKLELLVQEYGLAGAMDMGGPSRRPPKVRPGGPGQGGPGHGGPGQGGPGEERRPRSRRGRSRPGDRSPGSGESRREHRPGTETAAVTPAPGAAGDGAPEVAPPEGNRGDGAAPGSELPTSPAPSQTSAPVQPPPPPPSTAPAPSETSAPVQSPPPSTPPALSPPPAAPPSPSAPPSSPVSDGPTTAPTSAPDA